MEGVKIQFIYVVKPVKKNFSGSATEEENNIVNDHFYYLKSLLDKNILILAGPELKARFGIAVIETDTEQQAEEIMNNDPAVANKVFTAELFPFRVSLLKKQD
jgi:uncharacterized protein YciI